MDFVTSYNFAHNSNIVNLLRDISVVSTTALVI